MKKVRHTDSCNIRTLSTVLIGITLFIAMYRQNAFGQNGHPADEKQNYSLPTLHQVTIGAAHPVFVDPKTGSILWTADVQSSTANTSASGSLIGEMDGVDGVLYQSGKPQDKFTAAKLVYDITQNKVIARGGVRILSLTDRSTSLTCNTVVWYPAKGKMTGTGSVVFRSRGFTQTGPSFTADTKLKNVTMRSSPSQTVHMTFQP